MQTHVNERRVIGAALEAPGLWLAEASRINPDLFSRYRAIARELVAMSNAGEATDDVQAVAGALEARGVHVGLAELVELQTCAPYDADGMRAAVDALHRTAKRRGLARLASLLSKRAGDPEQTADDTLGWAQECLAQIAATSTLAVEALGSILKRVMGGLSSREATGVKTGLATLDGITGGLKPGELVVLGARPSMGKTALAIGVAASVAEAGQTVAVFSLEMSKAQIVQRLLASTSGVQLARIVTRRLGADDFTALVNTAGALHNYKIFVAEAAESLDVACRQIKSRHGLGLVVVDYLQLMSTKAQSREQEISQLSRQAKALARSLQCPVLVLSQLNREVERRPSKRPMLADLRESGSLEQDADVVLLLWRPAYYDDEADPAEAELVVAKHRNGPTGSIGLMWDQKAVRFTDPKST